MGEPIVIQEFTDESKEFKIELEDVTFWLSFHWRGEHLHHLLLSKKLKGLDHSYDIYIEDFMRQLAVLRILIDKAMQKCEELGIKSINLS